MTVFFDCSGRGRLAPAPFNLVLSWGSRDLRDTFGLLNLRKTAVCFGIFAFDSVKNNCLLKVIDER